MPGEKEGYVETLIKMPEIDHPKVMELYQKMGLFKKIITYEIEFKDLPILGPIKYKNGNVYYGQMKRGKKHGFGKMIQEKALYEGYWKDDHPHGFGRNIFTPTGEG